MACNESTNLRCGGIKQSAACVDYQGELPVYSSLDGCASVEQVAEELYDLITDIRDGQNLQTLAGECITYPTSGSLTVLQALTAMQNFICAQNEIITTMQTSIETLQAQVAELQANPCP